MAGQILAEYDSPTGRGRIIEGKRNAEERKAVFINASTEFYKAIQKAGQADRVPDAGSVRRSVCTGGGVYGD